MKKKPNNDKEKDKGKVTQKQSSNRFSAFEQLDEI